MLFNFETPDSTFNREKISKSENNMTLLVSMSDFMIICFQKKNYSLWINAERNNVKQGEIDVNNFRKK